jgi:hypothetical protein
MAYAGLRSAEACTVIHKSRPGDSLVIDRQVIELRASAKRARGAIGRVFRLGPPRAVRMTW